MSLTEEEADLYDRQIRLWGFDAQQKMKASKVLLVGFSSLNAEIAKNLVLAGVQSIVILENEKVIQEDFGSHLFISPEHFGKNRGTSSLERLQILNPLVKIQSDERSLDSVNPEFFSQFAVVCVNNGLPLIKLIWLDEICRKNGIFLFISQVLGFHGYFFSDLTTYEFTKKIESENKIEKISVTFPSLQSALNFKLNALKRVPPLYYGLILLGKYYEVNGAYPDSDKPESINQFIQFCQPLLQEEKIQVQEPFLREIASVSQAKLSPVCAVLGGILGQEIIKVISGKEEPLHNFLFFSAMDTRRPAVVYSIPPS